MKGWCQPALKVLLYTVGAAFGGLCILVGIGLLAAAPAAAATVLPNSGPPGPVLPSVTSAVTGAASTTTSTAAGAVTGTASTATGAATGTASTAASTAAGAATGATSTVTNAVSPAALTAPASSTVSQVTPAAPA